MAKEKVGALFTKVTTVLVLAHNKKLSAPAQSSELIVL